MSAQSLRREIVHEVPLLRVDQRVGDAVKTIIEAERPALPVVEGEGRLHGIFGEREFIGAMFPGYLGELRSAAFVPESIDAVIDKRLDCLYEPVRRYANTERIAAGPSHSDAQLAETFLHHRVLIIPIVDERQYVTGIVTRWDFFKALAERLAERP